MNKYDAITVYLERFERGSFGKWNEHKGTGTSQDPLVLPFFTYDTDVIDFIEAFYKLGIGDVNYIEHMKSLQGKPIDDMSEEELITVLTHYIRGDRFCEGLLASKLNDGTIQRILRNLREI